MEGSQRFGGQEEENKEQDRYLPIANIGRIMKIALPKDAKIAKEARETVQECVSEFISFITSEACDKCKSDKRKTINGDDLLFSLNQLGFERYLDNLQLYYNKYKEAAKSLDKGDGINKIEDDLSNTAQGAVHLSKHKKTSGKDTKIKNEKPEEEEADIEESYAEEEDEVDEEEDEEEAQEAEMPLPQVKSSKKGRK